MSNLEAIEIKAFIPARDFELSKKFYIDLGFTLTSDVAGIAYFQHGNCSFLLQDFYQQAHAENFVMHLLVKDVEAWHNQLQKNNIAEKYGTSFGPLETQPWGMRDFTFLDPSGVLWRIGQNI